jgi:hypothetical protein
MPHRVSGRDHCRLASFCFHGRVRGRQAGTPRRYVWYCAPNWRQGRFLVPAGERGSGDPDGGVAQQDGLAQPEYMPGNGGHDRQVHRVADITAQAAGH